MRVAFITEMGFTGKIQSNHPNMRTEFAWMNALDADHYNIHSLDSLIGYDCVFLIFPKGKLYLSAEGSRVYNGENPTSLILNSNFIEIIKSKNKKLVYVQEGPHWWFNDYELPDQILFYNLLTQCDEIYSHNESDVSYYKGLLPGKEVRVMPTLMIEDSIKNIKPSYENKAIIGGNFARWYGGFESYMVASEFNVPIWTQTSHATRDGENQIPNLHHLPRVTWVDWMKQLSTFKYAVHLMPTVAAGTFSLNCAYFGIPCIGNKKVDTQRLCHPELSVDVDDVESAKKLAHRLINDPNFYKVCSYNAVKNYRDNYDIAVWKKKINVI